MIVGYLLKQPYNRVERPGLFFYNTYGGRQMDLIVSHRTSVAAIEIEPGQTARESFFEELGPYRISTGHVLDSGTMGGVYHGGGCRKFFRSGSIVMPLMLHRLAILFHQRF